MRASLERIGAKALSCIAVALLVATAGTRAHAQVRTVSGDVAKNAAHGGVIRTSDGAFIIQAVCMESFSHAVDLYAILSRNSGRSGCSEKEKSTSGCSTGTLTVSDPSTHIECDEAAEEPQELSRTSPRRDRINSSSASVRVTLIKSRDLSGSRAHK